MKSSQFDVGEEKILREIFYFILWWNLFLLILFLQLCLYHSRT